MRISGHLCTGLLAAIAVTAAVAGGGADSATLAEDALSRCLAFSGTSISDGGTPITAPPGLARAANVEVALLPGRGGRLFSYRGIGDEIACGIAIYGDVSASEKRRLMVILDRDKRWTRHAPGPYKLSDAHPAQESYWGDPLAPGVFGALMMERSPSGAAPTLEIDVHKELIR